MDLATIKTSLSIAKALYDVLKPIISPTKSFERELANTIALTITEYAEINPIQESNEKTPFYKSEVLTTALLQIKLLGYEKLDEKKIAAKIYADERISPPTIDQINQFLNIFEGNCKNNIVLNSLNFQDNYKHGIFKILEILNDFTSEIRQAFENANKDLDFEFQAELDEILQNIQTFKPLTAYDRLQGIERRVKNSGKFSGELAARILFLKGSCLIERYDLEGCKLIIEAMHASTNQFRAESTVAYLNLNDRVKAEALAKQVIQQSPYNLNAWIVLAIINVESLREFLSEIPKNVRDDERFNVHVAYAIWFNAEKTDIEIEEFYDRIPKDCENDITHLNLKFWAQVALIHVNKYLLNGKQFSYDKQGHIRLEASPDLSFALKLSKKIYEAIGETELKDAYPILRFYHLFFSNLLENKPVDSSEMLKLYETLHMVFPFNVHYAQFLANRGEVKKAIEILEQASGTEEIILLNKVIYYQVVGNLEMVESLFRQLIKSMSKLTFAGIYNINNFFILIQSDPILLRKEFEECLRTKEFESQDIRELFVTTFNINYDLPNQETHYLEQSLFTLKDKFQNDSAISLFVAELLYKIGAFGKAASALRPFVTNEQNEITNLCCEAWYKSLQELPKLAELLKDIREHNSQNQRSLLILEMNLRLSIDDTENVIDISWRGIKQFPSVEMFHLNLIVSLSRTRNNTDLSYYVQRYLKKEFQDEQIGIAVSNHLRSEGFIQEGETLLFNLANNIKNSIARQRYLCPPGFSDGFFKSFDQVEANVSLKLRDDKNNVKFVFVTPHDKNLIGKKLGDTILIPGKLSAKLIPFILERIMNDKLRLFEEILEESKQPHSDLEILNLDFLDKNNEFSIEKFHNYMLSEFGAQEAAFEEFRSEQLRSYYSRTGSFAELCRSNFESDPVGCYDYLTSIKFVALPITNRAFENSETNYIIDFTGLCLLSSFQKESSCTYPMKFLISTSIQAFLLAKIKNLQVENASARFLIRNGQVILHKIPENFYRDRLARYSELLEFCEMNCHQEIIDEKMTTFNEEQVNLLLTTLIDSSLLCNKPMTYLLTNDRFYIKGIPGMSAKMISFYSFINVHLPEFYERFISHCLKNKYIGLPLTVELIYEEYAKYTYGKANNLDICLESLSFKASNSIENIVTGIQFIKKVFLNSIQNDRERRLLTQRTLHFLLDGFEQNSAMIQFIRLKIQSEFRLTGNLLNEINEIFFDILKIQRNRFLN